MKLRFLKPGLLALLLSIQPVFWGCSGASEEGDEMETADTENAASIDNENVENSDENAAAENYAEENYENAGGDTEEMGANAGEEGDYEDASGEQMNAANPETDSDLQQIISDLNQGNGTEGGEAPVNLSANPEGDVPAVVDQNVMEAATEAPAQGGEMMAATAPTSGNLPEPGSKMPYVVQSGDTLAKIAAKVYGSGEKWPEIQKLSNLKDPSKIYPGEVVYYQLSNESQTFATTYENAPIKEVTVNQGDSLSSIAAQVYGSAARWKTIWRQNGHITNPDKVSVGTVIYYVDYAAVGMTAKVIKAEKSYKSVSKSGTSHSYYQTI